MKIDKLKAGIYIALISIILISCGILIGVIVESKKNVRIVHVNFEEEINEVEDYKYKNLPLYLSNYIESLSAELDIDSDLVVAILMVENPSFDPEAEHRNPNGTSDLGLFQMNSRYIWRTFVPDYWDLDIDFDPYNPKHNTFLALHHIQNLKSKLKVQDDVIAAYNCGIQAVMDQKIPASTRYYVIGVNNNLRLLKTKSIYE